MAHKTFISYKWSEAQDVRDRIIDALGDDASYYKGGWWDYKTIGPIPYVDIIDPHILRYNFGFLF